MAAVIAVVAIVVMEVVNKLVAVVIEVVMELVNKMVVVVMASWLSRGKS